MDLTNLFPLAAIENFLPFLIPIMAISIPIIAILVSHQQKMAQIIHNSQKNSLPNPEIDALRREIQELKEITNQQAIALDSLQSRRAIPQSSSADRFSEV